MKKIGLLKKKEKSMLKSGIREKKEVNMRKIGMQIQKGRNTRKTICLSMAIRNLYLATPQIQVLTLYAAVVFSTNLQIHVKVLMSLAPTNKRSLQ